MNTAEPKNTAVNPYPGWRIKPTRVGDSGNVYYTVQQRRWYGWKTWQTWLSKAEATRVVAELAEYYSGKTN